MQAATAYAASKGVGVIGWAHTREFDTYEKAAATMRTYADWDLKGAKIDFFDHEHKEVVDHYTSPRIVPPMSISARPLALSRS